MSDAVRELIELARYAAMLRIMLGKNDSEEALARKLYNATMTVESELNKSPAEQHQERLEEVLKWNR